MAVERKEGQNCNMVESVLALVEQVKFQVPHYLSRASLKVTKIYDFCNSVHSLF